MTKLSVNINKIATLRNARGGNLPSVIVAATKAEQFGADGITVHPRPDERHITYQDVVNLKKTVSKEFNIEGNPNRKWLDLVLENKPTQATLVPDKPGVLTSNAGYDTINEYNKLKPIVTELQDAGIRVSIFINAETKFVQGAKELGANRIELYTGPYAEIYLQDKRKAIRPFKIAAQKALDLGIGVNAGHDLDLNNLQYFNEQIPNLLEVSIGHALISDSIYLGLENTIQMYQRCLKIDE